MFVVYGDEMEGVHPQGLGMIDSIKVLWLFTLHYIHFSLKDNLVSSLGAEKVLDGLTF